MRGWLPIVLVLWPGCERARPPEPMGLPARPEVALHGVRLWMFRGSEPTMRGRAARVTFNRQTSGVSAQETLVQLRPATAAAARQVEIRAPQLDGLLATRQADLSGGVQLVSQAGELRGETERAHFDGSQMVASGDRPVRLRGPGSALAADGFTFDFPHEVYEFGGHVVTEVERGLR